MSTATRQPYSTPEELAAFLRGVPASSLTASAQSVLATTRDLFVQHFGQHADVACGIAPGRVNLIGEHTDYNQGFVMPLAIDRFTAVIGRRNGLDRFRIISANSNQGKEHAPAPTTGANGDAMEDTTPAPVANGTAANLSVELDMPAMLQKYNGQAAWHNYFRGVVAQFAANGHAIPYFDVAISGNVPLGGGLSSSASLEVATAAFLQSLLQVQLDPITRALWCQKCEHDFCNVPCGVMDQFISSIAEKDHVMMLDCRSLQPQLVSFTDPNVALLITNSNVKHGLGDGQYELRVKQCAAAVKALQLKWPQIQTLRDTTLEQVMQMEPAMDEDAFGRARHIVTENDRVQQAAVCLATGDYEQLGKLMVWSHVSMKNDYEISCDEIDALVDIALELPGVYGTRMTGGGFGGCTITLVKASEVEKVQEAIEAEYKEQTGLEATCLVTRPGRRRSDCQALKRSMKQNQARVSHCSSVSGPSIDTHASAATSPGASTGSFASNNATAFLPRYRCVQSQSG